jgi:cysteine synthase A
MYNIFLTFFIGLFCIVFSDKLTNAPSSFQNNEDRDWRSEAILKLWKERQKMGHTPLKCFKVPGMPHLDLTFKDESKARTGSVKHRFAWCLWMWGLLEGHINENITVYESSTGNSAASEAYFAQLIGVPFVAVLSNTIEEVKENIIKSHGAEILKTESSKTHSRAESEAEKNGGFFMNQYGNAAFAEEFHESGNSKFESVNLMHEIITQLKKCGKKAPDYFVHTAATGGTISSVGKYIQKHNLETKVVLADTEFSTYFDYLKDRQFTNESAGNQWIKPGLSVTGFGNEDPVIFGKTSSLLPALVDQAYKIPDLASVAAMHFLKGNGINGGTSTGIDFVASLSLAATSKQQKNLSIVTVLGDDGSHYEATYNNLTWIEENFKVHGGIRGLKCWKKVITNSYKKGSDPLEEGSTQCDKYRSKAIQ